MPTSGFESSNFPEDTKTSPRDWLDKRAAIHGFVATFLLAAMILAGSRGLRSFDAALVGYTFACLFAMFGVVYRYSVWLSKPPTRMYWRRSLDLFLSPRMWKGLRAPVLLTGSVWRKLLWQDFILKRGFWRWAGHMAIAWGCLLASAVTFPLVFGWLYFESVPEAAETTFRVVVVGHPLMHVKVESLMGWGIFHALVIASFLVIPGVMIAMYRRMVQESALAVQTLSRDLLPLVLLFLVSFSGLMLWVSYEYMGGYFYSVMAQFHALCVIGTLLYMPFGKLFHIFQRPASIGISYYRAAGKEQGFQACPITGSEFASTMQVSDLSKVLKEVGFDYERDSLPKQTGISPAWNHVSPQGRRILIGRAHSKLLSGSFSKRAND